MKSTVIFSLCLVFSGCSHAVTNSEPVGTDHTVTPLGTTYKTDSKNVMNLPSGFFASASVSPDSMIEKAEQVIDGTISNIIYTDVDGMPWIQADVIVNEAFKGDLQRGDTVSVYMMGGYVPLKLYADTLEIPDMYADLSAEELENSVVCDMGTFSKLPESGESYLFCLLANDESTPFPDGSYRRASGAEYCMYGRTEEGNYANGAGSVLRVNGMGNFKEIETAPPNGISKALVSRKRK